MQHAYDRDTGNKSSTNKLNDPNGNPYIIKSPDPEGNDKPLVQAEVNAVNLENRIRRVTGDPQRTSYGGINIKHLLDPNFTNPKPKQE